MEDKKLQEVIEKGVQLEKMDAALQLGMRIWKVKGLEIPELHSAEFREMLEAGRKLMENSPSE